MGFVWNVEIFVFEKEKRSPAAWQGIGGLFGEVTVGAVDGVVGGVGVPITILEKSAPLNFGAIIGNISKFLASAQCIIAYGSYTARNR